MYIVSSGAYQSPLNGVDSHSPYVSIQSIRPSPPMIMMDKTKAFLIRLN